MGNPTALRAFRTVQTSISSSCRSAFRPQGLSGWRPFSHSSRALAAEEDSTSTLLNNVDNAFRRASPYSSLIPNSLVNLAQKDWAPDDRHHLHIFSTKHNTHITLTKPNRDSLISVSCGNIGFRKSGRGTYDAAYQLAAFVMSRIQDKGLLPEIQKVELIYRGFGPGREAVTKAILGSEGKKIRPLIVQLSDSTRLKFGGTRSKKPRRLG